MMKSVKTSRKQLAQTALNLDATKLANNVYCYENAIHYLCMLQAHNKLFEDNKAVEELISRYPNATCVTYSQLFYSCGIYGNNGQLHRVDFYENDEIIGTEYVYYC